MNNLALLVALCMIPGIGGVTLQNLLDHFGSLEAIQQATDSDLQTVPGVGPQIATAIHNINVVRTRDTIAAWEQDGISILTKSNLRQYPAALYHLRDAPPILFCRGVVTAEDERAVAIVGTRQPTPPARYLAEAMGYELAARGWTIVSGLAWGIDMAAHQGARQNGRTIALLGSGVNQIPRKKKALAGQIMTQGAVLSEMHPNATPKASSLVARNRLIAGMSKGVIVIEAGEESGSLYTANFATKQNRPVYAVANGSPGNTQLLNNGARCLPPSFSDWDSLSQELATL